VDYEYPLARVSPHCTWLKRLRNPNSECRMNNRPDRRNVSNLATQCGRLEAMFMVAGPNELKWYGVSAPGIRFEPFGRLGSIRHTVSPGITEEIVGCLPIQ